MVKTYAACKKCGETRSLTGSGLCGPCMQVLAEEKAIKKAALAASADYAPGYVAPGPFADERDYYDDSDTNDRDASETETVDDKQEIGFLLKCVIAAIIAIAAVYVALQVIKSHLISKQSAPVVAPAPDVSDGRVYVE